MIMVYNSTLIINQDQPIDHNIAIKSNFILND